MSLARVMFLGFLISPIVCFSDRSVTTVASIDIHGANAYIRLTRWREAGLRSEMQAIRRLAEERRSRVSGSVREELDDFGKRIETDTEAESSLEYELGQSVESMDVSVKDDLLTVTTTMTCSDDLAVRQRESLEGERMPDSSWVSAFKTRWLDPAGATIPNRLLFSEQNGFVHHLGIGVASFDENSFAQRRNVLMAQELARKNLRLFVAANGYAQVLAGERLEIDDDSNKSSESQLINAADLRQNGAVVPQYDVGTWVVDVPCIGQKVTVCVCELESVRPKAINMRQMERGIPNENGSRVKRFNPATGRFE